jgi:DNA-binding NtrC family response regulator
LLVSRAPGSTQAELEQMGCYVLAQSDCAGALRSLLGRHFDVAVIDLDCPDESDFLRKLRSCDPALQVVVLSGRTAPSTPPLIEAVSSADYCHKPVPPQELHRTIAKSIQITRLVRENQQLRLLVSRDRTCFSTMDAPLNVARQELNSDVMSHVPMPVPLVGSDADLDTISRAHVLSVLEQHNGNKARTARALGINRRSLYRLLDKYAAHSLQNI